jgi:hypothetical protein
MEGRFESCEELPFVGLGTVASEKTLGRVRSRAADEEMVLAYGRRALVKPLWGAIVERQDFVRSISGDYVLLFHRVCRRSENRALRKSLTRSFLEWSHTFQVFRVGAEVLR